MYHTPIPPDLELAIHSVYPKVPLIITHIVAEPESAEYGAFQFMVGNKSAKFRIAKITPTKPGLFVTVWQRDKQGRSAPFHISDAPELIIISTRKEELIGHFIFPKNVLLEKGIVSGNEKDGKRGIRVYPPWEKNLNEQAAKTQCWQILYFLDLGIEVLNLERAQLLYAISG